MVWAPPASSQKRFLTVSSGRGRSPRLVLGNPCLPLALNDPQKAAQGPEEATLIKPDQDRIPVHLNGNRSLSQPWSFKQSVWNFLNNTSPVTCQMRLLPAFPNKPTRPHTVLSFLLLMTGLPARFLPIKPPISHRCSEDLCSLDKPTGLCAAHS